VLKTSTGVLVGSSRCPPSDHDRPYIDGAKCSEHIGEAAAVAAAESPVPANGPSRVTPTLRLPFR